MRSKIRVEIFVKGSCTRCGYDRLIKINTVSSSDPPGYFCHSCGALRLKTEITEHQTFLTSHEPYAQEPRPASRWIDTRRGVQW